MDYWGYRYLGVHEFNSYCSDLNVKMDAFNRELEMYEKEGVLFPVARVIKPDQYAIQRAILDRKHEGYGQSLSGWEDLEQLLNVSPKLHLLPDEDLWHPFDVEIEHGNPFLHIPVKENFKPWDSFKAKVEWHDPEGISYSVSTVEHYYHYWQVHQVYQIQHRYPVFAKHNWLLEHLSNEVQDKISWYKPNPENSVATLSGYLRCFDALSFYICLATNQRQKTFASISQKHGVKELNDQQLAAHESELARHARFVCNRYKIDRDRLYEFLVFLLDLQSKYQEEERTKLANALDGDVMFLAQLIRGVTGQTYSEIEQSLGKLASIWTQKQFRHLDKFLLVQDGVHDVLTHFLPQYNKDFPLNVLTEEEVGRLEQFLRRQGLFLINYTIFDVQEILNNPRPFEKTSFYIAVKNLTTGFECCLRELGMIAKNRSIRSETLYTLVSSLFIEWAAAFQKEHKSKRKSAVGDDVWYIDDVYTDPNLDNTLKNFLIAYGGRNLLAHKYSVEDDLYDVYCRVYQATIFALFYTWKYAVNNTWI